MTVSLESLPDRSRRTEARGVPRFAPDKARVLVVLRWPVGGIRTHLLYNYPTAAEHGYRFTFVGPDDATWEAFADTFRGLPGAEFVGVPVRGPRCRLWTVVRRLTGSGRFSLLHSHGVTAAVHAAAGNLGRGLPHLTTLHDVFRPCHFAGWRGRVKRWLLGRALRRVNTLVAVGDDVRANLLEYLPALRRSPARVVTIPNGIDVEKYAAAVETTTDLRRQLGLSPDVFLLGFLGRFMEQKGFLPLLQALERLRTVEPGRAFHLIAVGSGDYRREYRREIERRGLADRVALLDFTPDVRPVLRQLDLLVVPSLWEASPLQPMEAMAAGVPVLGTDCIGLREVLRGTPSRVAAAGDPASLCEALRAALRSPWTGAAREFAAEACARFDNAPSARRLADLFDELSVPR